MRILRYHPITALRWASYLCWFAPLSYLVLATTLTGWIARQIVSRLSKCTSARRKRVRTELSKSHHMLPFGLQLTRTGSGHPGRSVVMSLPSVISVCPR
jgi:hypothetical protein